MSVKTYFVSNKSTKTIGGVQTIMRLIEEAHPNHSFIELPIVDSESDHYRQLLPNVEVVHLLEKINNYLETSLQTLFEFEQEKKKLLGGGSKLIIFGVQKLLLIPEDFLKNNEVIVFQSTRPDLTFGLPKLSQVPKLLENKVKHINKFVTFTKQDQQIIKGIIDQSDLKTQIQWFIIPNPSKTKRQKITRYTKNVMYLGRFDLFQKNILEYIKIDQKLDKDFQLNMYGYGPAEPLLKSFNLNVKGKIDDISEVAADNSILLLLSSSEGFGNVLIEAMSVGMPIIVYDAYPAAKSIVSEGVGKLIPFGETDQVIAAIENILASPEDFEKFSTRAYQVAAKYEKDKILKKYQEVLNIN